MATQRRPIRIKKANRGKTRAALGAKPGKKLTQKQLSQAKKSPPKGLTTKQITFAQNAKRWNKSRGRSR